MATPKTASGLSRPSQLPFSNTSVYSPMSSFQSSGLSLMNLAINSSHCLFFMFTTSMPKDSNNFSAPTKLAFSPITTLLTPYMIHAPEHMLQGDKVVYMVQFLYTFPGNLPAFSNVEISPCKVAESFWILWLCPRPNTVPSSCMRAPPMGIPPWL